MISRKEIYAIVAIFVLTIVGACVYIGNIKAVTKAETTEEIGDKLRKQWQADLKDVLAQIAKDRQEVKTPAQIVQAVPRYTPDVKPILIVPGGVPTNVSTVEGNIPSISLPDAPSAISAGSLVIPSEQVPAYWKSVTSCAEDHANLGVCTKDLAQTTDERDKWKKATKGTFWGRTKTALKWMAIGGAIGAGAVAATH